MSEGQPVVSEGASVQAGAVRGVKLYQLPMFSDHRGSLAVGEFGAFLPFVPQRYFITYQVPGAHVRGEHAHRECAQLLTCVRGGCTVLVDDGVRRETFRLEDPRWGLLVPPMVWAAEYDHTEDSVLVVFASHAYDGEDYVRDYAAFQRMAAEA
jgi:UDP-2-acetamido-3-amino-2,3-dideoxy-glucuronate N-acetyltransferase